MDLAKENQLQAELVTVESPEIGPVNQRCKIFALQG